ncbi:class I SAM-dependent methyltransferase [Paenibacillus sp. p3-SID867]|uniref:class I SAM-dependent methyltransferase n=1 Tax=Paenibacillus sp. p3-SID867 TaxID=2916363 RepID=UPI0021A37518|nr:class I SAM-dependent methyltransferase [Paenibacillus sp. p3-SID867]MCT1400266.1 class I SAM-dependent methyltransferase [Paenibacillus sp. p3-SID867]
MNSQEYKQFYDIVGALNGWDFSQLRCISEGMEWDFYDEVGKLCKSSDVVLDIGTGGGESLLSIADQAALLVGIDLSHSMIETAQSNKRKAAASNVRFMQMDAESLQFPEAFFNLISCRHSPFRASEVGRVLEEDGVFLTQQVRESDKANLAQAFGRGQSSREDGALKDQYMEELWLAGFRNIQYAEYDADEYYEREEDLIFLLKHTPIIPGFGQEEPDFRTLQQFIRDHRTDRGIRTNSARFMIVARK